MSRQGERRSGVRAGFVIRCSREVFSEEEIEMLETYGTAFYRLGEADRAPRTDGQRRFVEVVHGVQEPETKYEKTWSKYLQRVEWEKDPENRAAMGPHRKFHDDRDDWRRTAGAQWGEMIRRARGLDD